MKKTHARIEIAVVGRGDFPIDMLRYDSCAPLAQTDAFKITEGHDLRVIDLEMFTQGRGPTDARWRSFGWIVLSPDERAAFHLGKIDTLKAVLAARGVQL